MTNTIVLTLALLIASNGYALAETSDSNKQQSILVPALEVPLANVLLWSFDRYVVDARYSRISVASIQRNFREGWVWDTDDFPTNFSLHPYLGSAYFNCARSNGFNFYQSVPFALGGSAMWELFMENTRPSYNDLVNTTVSGVFLGEVLYRLSSNVFDDAETGPRRAFREIAGTLIDPVRGFNRLLRGDMFRVSQFEGKQNAPLKFSIAAGSRKTSGVPQQNETGPLTDAILHLNLTYGDPFPQASRTPFDYFNLRAEFASGDLKHVARSVIGDAFLFGANTTSERHWKSLFAGFQHYDYWNTDSFEIGTLGIGASFLSRMPVHKTGSFNNELHLALVPLGASNARKLVTGELNPGFQNYTYSGGAQVKLKTAVDLRFVQIGAEYYLYWLHTYVGQSGDNLIGILRPRASVKLYRALHLGYEYFLYQRKDSNAAGPTIHVSSHEHRLYLLLDL